MNKADRLAKLKELIQLAITDYVSETDDYNCSAQISVRVEDGWTAVPEIKSYSSNYFNDDDTDEDAAAIMSQTNPQSGGDS